MSSPKACVILNAAAGSGIDEAALRQLETRFIERGVEFTIYRAQDGAQLRSYAQRAVEQGMQLVIAAGGDGTLSTVAAELKDSPSTLGILPWGTLNHFAKDCGIPLEAQEAINVLLDGQTQTVDVGEVNGHIFINNSSLGLYPHAVRRRDSQRRRFGWGKMRAFFWASLSLLRLFPMLHIKLSCDGQSLLRRTPFVFIGNNEYIMEGFRMADRVSLQRGCLSVYTSHNAGRLGLLRLALRALIGRLHQAKGFDTLITQALTIETRRPSLQVALDGEVTTLSTPLHYRIHPAALQVKVPKMAVNANGKAI